MGWLQAAAAVASVGSSLLGSRSADKAADAQVDAAREQINYARETRDLIRGDQEPYREAGYSSLNQLLQLSGVPVPTSVSQAAEPGPYRSSTTSGYQIPSSGKASVYDVQQAYRQFRGRAPTPYEIEYYTGRERADQLYNDIVATGYKAGRKAWYGPEGPSDYTGAISEPKQSNVVGSAPKPQETKQQTIEEMVKTDPSYEFRLNEGMRALERSRAAAGGLLSGGTARGITRYAQDYASTEYGKIYDRIANIAGLGQTGVANTAGGVINAGNVMSNAASNAGFARASGYTAQGNQWANAINELAKVDWGGVFSGGRAGSPPPDIFPTVTMRS